VYDAKANKLYGLNASGWAPKGLTIEYLRKQGVRSMPQQGVNAITVPGAVDGWQKLADKFGRKKLAEDLAAAIRTAQDGFPVPEWTAAYWAGEVDYLRTDETAGRLIFQEIGRRKWARCFAMLNWHGRLSKSRNTAERRFTRAKLPQRSWSDERHNGPMATQDLSEYSSEFVEPISTTYRDWTVYELPPTCRVSRHGNAQHHGNFSTRQKDWGFGSTKAVDQLAFARPLCRKPVSRPAILFLRSPM